MRRSKKNSLRLREDANPFVEQAFEHATFFTRLHHFVLMSDAYIVAPVALEPCSNR